MRNVLKAIVSFVAVAPGATVELPHGLNISGTSVIPDEIKRRTEGLFQITADKVNVRVKNLGNSDADVDVLCERWHGVPRELGIGNDGYGWKTNLPIQPWQSQGDANDDAGSCCPFIVNVDYTNNPYNAKNGDVILVDSSIAPIVINAPSASAPGSINDTFTVKNFKGGCSTHGITVVPDGTDVIESPTIDADKVSKTWISDGAGNWVII